MGVDMKRKRDEEEEEAVEDQTHGHGAPKKLALYSSSWVQPSRYTAPIEAVAVTPIASRPMNERDHLPSAFISP